MRHGFGRETPDGWHDQEEATNPGTVAQSFRSINREPGAWRTLVQNNSNPSGEIVLSECLFI